MEGEVVGRWGDSPVSITRNYLVVTGKTKPPFPPQRRKSYFKITLAFLFVLYSKSSASAVLRRTLLKEHKQDRGMERKHSKLTIY